MADEKPKICFDKEYKIRILDPAKAEHAEELNTECSGFVESTAKICFCDHDAVCLTVIFLQIRNIRFQW